MFISLSASLAGYACAVRSSIDKYYKQSETQFFDWLICSMKSINEVLQGKPILFENKYSQYSPDSISINFKDFDLLTSVHDIDQYNIDYTIIQSIEKYNRRYNRFIHTIKNEKYIFFIRYCNNSNELDEEQINKFFNNIRNINNNLYFILFLISDCNNLIIPDSLTNNGNFIYINLNWFIDDDIIKETDEYEKRIKQYKCVFNIFDVLKSK